MPELAGSVRQLTFAAFHCLLLAHMAPTPPWIIEGLAALRTDYGEVPPPWIVFPGEHPYSICWRMGGGESHLLLWQHWWESQSWLVAQRLAYFRQWPPPPRWLVWVATAVWDLDLEVDEDEEQTAYAPYFTELERQGLGTWVDYEQDIDDPKWLEE